MTPAAVEFGCWDAERLGPLTEAAMRDWLAVQGYVVARYDYAPGTCFPPHRHEVDKIDAVLAGCLRIEMAGRRVDLGPGMWIRVPRAALHSAEVIGPHTVVSLDAVWRGSAPTL